MATILVIEDHEHIRADIVQVLELNGYQAFGAGNGFEGIRLARSRHPSLIVCDIIMPDMDGYEVLEELRLDSMTATIPFIFLTALTDKPAQRKGMLLGADDYLTKPFEHADLLRAIEVRLHRQAQMDADRGKRLLQEFIKTKDRAALRLAQSLDRQVTQRLSNLRLSLDLFSSLPEDSLQRHLPETVALIDTCIQQLSEAVINLHPSMLDHLGLLPTLLQYTAQYQQLSGIELKFTHNNLHPRPRPEVELAAFHIVQQGLANIASHAGILQASLFVGLEADRLLIQIEDFGQGFHLESALQSGQGTGLIEMQQRAHSLGGSFSIESAPGQGTRIKCALPAGPTAEHGRSLANLYQWAKQSQRITDVTPATNQPISVLIADVQPLLRQALRVVLQAEPDIAVVADLTDWPEIEVQAGRLQPDLLLLDQALAGPEAREWIERIRQQSPALRVLLMCSTVGFLSLDQNIVSMADGFVLKSITGYELLRAVRFVCQGAPYISTALTPSMEMSTEHGTKTMQNLMDYWTLTQREREVLRYVAIGMKNADIAEALAIGVRTVETHRANLMRKLEFKSSADLVHFAVRHGIVTVSA